MVSTDGSGKRPLPPKLRVGLESALTEGEQVQTRGELTITGMAQREAWLRRVMPPAEQLDQDLWSLPVPIPANPLRYVSVYAFGTGESLVLIDAGWGAEESWLALRDGLESIGAGMADVRGVLVTHMHFDHVGLAGRVRQASGAWIAMHPADQAVFARLRLPQCGAGGGRGGGVPARPGRVAGRGCRCGGHRRTVGEVHHDRAARPPAHGRGAGRRARLEAPRRAHPRPHPGAPVLRGRAVAQAVFRRSRAAPDHPQHLRPARRSSRPARGLPGLAGQDAGPRRGRGVARARVAVSRPARAGRRHRGPPRATARRTTGRDPPASRLHPLAAGRGADLVPALGSVQRPDADLRGHRDRRARAPAGAPRPGDREPDPPARVHGEGA